MMDNDKRLEGLETCEVLVCSVLASVMDQINNLKVKGLRVLLSYQFGSEMMKGISKKMEFVEAVKDFKERIGGYLQRWGSGVSVVTNEGVNDAGEDMGERSIFLVYLEYNGVGYWSGGYAH